MDHAWTCACRGRQYNTLPLDFGCAAPDDWLLVPEAERAARGRLGADLCEMDGYRFVRGCLRVPVIGRADTFVWGVWVSVSQQSFMRIAELWNASGIVDEPTKFGWLRSRVLPYPDTENLKTRLHLRDNGQRPFIELEPTDHPLAIEQRRGISVERVRELVAMLMHRH